MKIGILGAMPEEVNDLKRLLKNTASTEIGKRHYLSGSYETLDIVLVFSRWGKVAAASTATTLIDRFQVDLVLFAGLAGAANPKLEIGDVVIATELMQHDMDASALPMFQKHEIPLLHRRSFAVLPEHINLAQQAAKKFLSDQFKTLISPQLIQEFRMPNPSVVAGLIASGDQFIADAKKITQLRNELPELQCIEMEGGAVAQVCYEHDVPFIVVRIISDKADHTSVMDFPKFVANIASPISGGIVEEILVNLSKSC